MNFLVVIGKCGSFYIYHHEKAGKKIEIKCPAENNFQSTGMKCHLFIGIFQQLQIDFVTCDLELKNYVKYTIYDPIMYW